MAWFYVYTKRKPHFCLIILWGLILAQMPSEELHIGPRMCHSVSPTPSAFGALGCACLSYSVYSALESTCWFSIGGFNPNPWGLGLDQMKGVGEPHMHLYPMESALCAFVPQILTPAVLCCAVLCCRREDGESIVHLYYMDVLLYN